jgi:hypothetical protein
MSAWTEFVKAHYSKSKHLPNKERLAFLSKMFKDQGSKKAYTDSAPHAGKMGKKMRGGYMNVFDELHKLG